MGYNTSPNRLLFYTGIGLFGGAYATSAIVAAQSDRDADKKLYWPLAGPCSISVTANATCSRAITTRATNLSSSRSASRKPQECS